MPNITPNIVRPKISSSALHFPFTAVEGQKQLKLALILCAIDPKIGGVLISGDKGSAKSTLARSIADILPNPKAKFITVPLGCSSDMLVGSLNLQKVLEDKQVSFQPGLIAKAHEGILYVDEVNLLPDTLVDQLLDVAASNINKVERDGISHEHEANFVLLGTMNPDEGQLRSQLLDRFALNVELSSILDANTRVNIIKKTQAFHENATAFCDSYNKEQQNLKNKIINAQQTLKSIELDDSILLSIANICIKANIEGMRGDIVLTKSAKAHAAWLGKTKVDKQDIDAVQEFVLSHRRKHSNQQSTPPTTPPTQPQKTQTSDNSKTKDKPNTQNESKDEYNDGEDWGSMLKKSHNEIIHQALTIPDTKNIQIKKKEPIDFSLNTGKNTVNKISW
ncbi:MAG: ATP-binding protein, partial [Saccharospirillaceae bacterium]|nr:ATP-binding protein [Pseudomonadales bacterium]NRB80250.1 ATP-binding protein [Saccharospirillaceae bacterium]